MSTPAPPPPPATPQPPGRSAEVVRMVTNPAIALMIVAGLTIVLQLLGFVMNLLGIGMMGMSDMSQFEGMEGMEWMAPLMSGTISLVTGVIVIVIAGLILFGAVKMKAFESYGLAMTAAILAIIPCTTTCCLGIPFGIWALVVLLKPEVKSAFGV